MKEPLGILRVGALCPVGLDVDQTAASVMAGLPRKLESVFLDRNGEPIIVGHLPIEVLPASLESVESKPPRVGQLVDRLLRLATPALQEALDVYPPGRTVESRLESPAAFFGNTRPPLYLAAPQPPPGEPSIVDGSILGQLARQAHVPLDLTVSRLFPLGHAGLFHAIEEAEAKVIAPGLSEFVIVGGVDSYFDARRLLMLESERRLLTSGVEDAVTPGEGAAFLLLASRRTCYRYGLNPLAWISGVASAMEPGHRYSEAVHRGEGLTSAVAQALTKRGAGAPLVRLVMAGLTGESLHAKEWGIAYIRSREHFGEPLRVEHPAEYMGDSGAALVPISLALTATLLRAQRLEGPALLWGSSDQAERGALVVDMHRSA